MVRKAHLGLMVLAAWINLRSFMSGLTYEHHELSQDCYLRSPNASTNLALLFHLLLISCSYTLISFMPICTLFDWCLWIHSQLFVPLFRQYNTRQFHTVVRILNFAVLARKIRIVPASSAASERTFSAAGQTITERRKYSLKPDTADSIILLHAKPA